MHDDSWIRVEVSYALPDQQWLLTINVPENCRLAEAIERSGLHDKVPGGLPADGRYGIWSKLATADAQLQDGDRIEIYRPLIADPKEARRIRAKQKAEDSNASS